MKGDQFVRIFILDDFKDSIQYGLYLTQSFRELLCIIQKPKLLKCFGVLLGLIHNLPELGRKSLKKLSPRLDPGLSTLK